MTKEKVVRTARKMKPDRLMFYEDFAQRTLQGRRELIPELIRRRKQGKQAFVVRTGSWSMTLIKMKLRPRHNLKITLNLLFFILFYFLQFINNVSCNI